MFILKLNKSHIDSGCYCTINYECQCRVDCNRYYLLNYGVYCKWTQKQKQLQTENIKTGESVLEKDRVGQPRITIEEINGYLDHPYFMSRKCTQKQTVRSMICKQKLKTVLQLEFNIRPIYKIDVFLKFSDFTIKLNLFLTQSSFILV